MVMLAGHEVDRAVRGYRGVGDGIPHLRTTGYRAQLKSTVDAVGAGTPALGPAFSTPEKREPIWSRTDASVAGAACMQAFGGNQDRHAPARLPLPCSRRAQRHLGDKGSLNFIFSMNHKTTNEIL